MVGDDHREIVMRGVAAGVVEQDVAVADCTIGDAGDGEVAISAVENLPNRGDRDPVERDRIRPVERGVDDCPAGAFGGRGRVRALGLRPACRKRAFVDARCGIDRTGRLVGSFKHDRRLVVDDQETGIPELWRRIAHLGRRDQVAERNARIERWDGDSEIATTRLRRAGRGLRLRIDQKRGKVGRRNLDSAEYQLGHEHRAIDDDHVGAVGHVDDEIATDDMDVAQRDSRGKRDDAVGPGRNALGIGEILLLGLDADREMRGVLLTVLVGNRVGEGVSDAIGAAGVAGVDVIAMGIDADVAVAALRFELSAMLRARSATGPDDRDEEGVTRAERVRTGMAADGAKAAQGVAGGRGVRAGGNDVVIVVRRQAARMIETVRSRLREIFVAHDPPLVSRSGRVVRYRGCPWRKRSTVGPRLSGSVNGPCEVPLLCGQNKHVG